MSRVVAMRELNKDVPKEERSQSTTRNEGDGSSPDEAPQDERILHRRQTGALQTDNLGMAVAVEEGLIAPSSGSATRNR